jgi:ribonuclease Z
VAELIILGSASAIPDLQHENTHMLLQTENHRVLVDAPGNPIVRLQQAGIDPLSITELILTHFHPDHVAGAPLFLMVSWLKKRVLPLHVYGLDETLTNFEKLMDLYQWYAWPDMYPVIFHHLPTHQNQPVFTSSELQVVCAPVKHIIPNIGLRFTLQPAGTVVAYSSDTEPTQAVVQLAGGAHLLVHEASGASLGHTSAEQAGEIAAQAGAHRLMLIHYPTARQDQLAAEAQRTFKGEVLVARDLLRVPLS